MAKNKKNDANDVKVCLPTSLPEDKQEAAAKLAVEENPANRPLLEMILEGIRRVFDKVKTKMVEESFEESGVLQPGMLAVMTSKYWGVGGVTLPTAFLESTPQELQTRIFSHLNAWSAYGNVKFVPSSLGAAVIRITRSGQGYWSYLGTDNKMIGQGQPTMCLQGFSMSTPEAEYKRVVRHEAGHALGFPHEHARQDVVSLLDRQKTISFFRKTYGWSPSTTVQQVLTPLEESSLLGTEGSDVDSIMCYQLPGDCTISGKPIPGGLDICESDKQFVARIYPPLVPPPPPPTEGATVVKLTGPVGEVWVENKKVWPA